MIALIIHHNLGGNSFRRSAYLGSMASHTRSVTSGNAETGDVKNGALRK